MSMTAQSSVATTPAAPDSTGDHPGIDPARESGLERLCRWACRVALIALILIIGLDILTRSVFNYSLEIADELGGYLLAAITFLALAVTRAHEGFHRVEFLYDRLGPRGRLIAALLFDLLALLLALLLSVYLLRYIHATWVSGAVAPTRLMTPLWLAQLPMVLGMLAYFVSALRGVMGRWSALRRMPSAANPGRA
jgi:TRAP-type C4-dicarboxylate transport system permease small subunit